MFEILSNISNWALEVISQNGYLGIFLLSVADRVTFQFIPGELVFSLLGFLISQGQFHFVLALSLTVLGNLAGDTAIYWASLKGGRRFIDKFGRYFLISNHELGHIERLFAKHGSRLVFWGRFIPAVVTFISIPAGLAKMDFKKFTLFTVLGSLPRNFALIFIGFKTGENWNVISDYLRRFDTVIIIIIVALIAWYIYRHLNKKHLTHE